jgi:hypothetical protein
VILKLGSKLVHHYAHQPDETGLLPRCNATQPETALHLNSKFYLYDQLLTRLQHNDQLFIEQNCSGRCSRTRRLIWLEGWDEVQIEYALGGFRLDVALLLQGRVIGAVEVVVSHSTEPAKIEYFEAHHVRWIEIAGTETFFDPACAWTPDKPLPIDPEHLKQQSWYQEWTCPECQEKREVQRAHEHAELRKQQQARVREQKNTKRSVVKATRLVEIESSFGGFRRILIDVVQEYEAGKPSRVIVSTRDGAVLAEASGLLTAAVMARLDRVVRQWCERYRRRGATVDDSMPWQGNGIPPVDAPSSLFELE